MKIFEGEKLKSKYFKETKPTPTIMLLTYQNHQVGDLLGKIANQGKIDAKKEEKPFKFDPKKLKWSMLHYI